MKYLFCCFFFVLLMGCKSGRDAGNTNTVTGIAANAKAGAIVSASNGEVYLISGLDSWDSIYLEKRVKVTGHFTLKVSEDESNIQINKTEVKFAAQMYHRYYLVDHAKWELYNSDQL